MASLDPALRFALWRERTDAGRAYAAWEPAARAAVAEADRRTALMRDALARDVDAEARRRAADDPEYVRLGNASAPYRDGTRTARTLLWLAFGVTFAFSVVAEFVDSLWRAGTVVGNLSGAALIALIVAYVIRSDGKRKWRASHVDEADARAARDAIVRREAGVVAAPLPDPTTAWGGPSAGRTVAAMRNMLAAAPGLMPDPTMLPPATLPPVAAPDGLPAAFRASRAALASIAAAPAPTPARPAAPAHGGEAEF